MNILVTIPLSEENKHKLQLAAGSECIFTSLEDTTKEQVQEAHIIIGNVPPSYIEESLNLEWIQLNSAGTDGYCDKGILAKGTKLTNASGAYGLAISEYMVGMTFALKKKFHSYIKNQIRHKWQCEGTVGAISGSTVLILGLGDIGRAYAKRMKALGSYVIGVKRRACEKPGYVDELYYEEETDGLLKRADIVALTMPAYEKTKNFMTENRLKSMKTSAILINVGRGSLIDTELLYRALAEKWIAGAALDVITPEPFPSDHPLWDLENLILTPHISGGYTLPQTLEHIAQIAIDNMSRFVKGEKLCNVVDLKTGYKE